MKRKKKITIEQLERILTSGQDLDIEIQPDGSIRAVKAGTAKNAKPKIITMGELPASNY